MENNFIQKKKAPDGTLAERLDRHFYNLMEKLPKLDDGVEWLLPLKELPETAKISRLFLQKYYSDQGPRTLILGINPGRFGAGLTNVAFTDPYYLETECGIESSFPKKKELSAIFIWQMINAFGGAEKFNRRFFINSVVPFGFVKDGKNYNYYDDKKLQSTMEPLIKYHFEKLLELGMGNKVCFCLGQGKNFKYLSKLNKKEGYFEKVVPLAHPRFIMQYRRKKVGEYVEGYLEAFLNEN
ncbi:MAG TPA: DUF4918 family protein [Bacteroidetes bacterium]|nr:DUF4918 family protein [Bacteroidota bacterium]